MMVLKRCFITIHGVWFLKTPKSKVPIDCKWGFQVKRKPDDLIDRYKVQLVAKGFLQTAGRNYFETYSLVMKLVTIHVVLSIVLSNH